MGDFMKKILFICYGNICRSPMAEMIFNSIITEHNKNHFLSCDSKATSSEEIGNDIYYKAKEVLKKHNIEVMNHQACKVTKYDYNKYDYIVVMEERNKQDLLKIFENDTENKIKLLLDKEDIEDPWYTNRFEDVYQKIYKGCINLYKRIIEEDDNNEI